MGVFLYPILLLLHSWAKPYCESIFALKWIDDGEQWLFILACVDHLTRIM
jgi:hypothetical protein